MLGKVNPEKKKKIEDKADCQDCIFGPNCHLCKTFLHLVLHVALNLQTWLT